MFHHRLYRHCSLSKHKKLLKLLGTFDSNLLVSLPRKNEHKQHRDEGDHDEKADTQLNTIARGVDTYEQGDGAEYGSNSAFNINNLLASVAKTEEPMVEVVGIADAKDLQRVA